jgi:hypothetical protein
MGNTSHMSQRPQCKHVFQFLSGRGCVSLYHRCLAEVARNAYQMLMLGAFNDGNHMLILASSASVGHRAQTRLKVVIRASHASEFDGTSFIIIAQPVVHIINYIAKCKKCVVCWMGNSAAPYSGGVQTVVC